MVDSTIVVDKFSLSEEDLAVMASTPQHVMVLNHLLRFGSITGDEARRYYGITRLPAKVWYLKTKYDPPVRIGSEDIEGKNRFGKTVYYSKYFLEED